MPIDNIIRFLQSIVNRQCSGRTDSPVDDRPAGRMMNLYEVAEEISRRMHSIFLKDKQGRRPVFGGSKKFQTDPHWRDHLLFYEYFHGDNGAGLGASHQTGWTGLVAPMTQFLGATKAEDFLAAGKSAIYAHEW